MAVQFRHHDIAQDQVRFFPTRSLKPLASVCSLNGFIVLVPQQRGDVSPHLGFVFNDQNSFHGFFPKTGSLIVTVVPSPTLLFKVSFPPCKSAQRLTSNRPRPVPGRVPTLPPR